MSESKLICLLGLVSFALYTKIVSSQAMETSGQVIADVNAKIALMEKVINSIVQRAQEAENKLHTIETQLTNVKAQDEKLIQGLTNQMKASQEQRIISETNLNVQIKVLQKKVAQLTTSDAVAQAKQQVLQNQVTGQAAQINKLDTKGMNRTNLKQVAWTLNDDTDSGIIKTLSFTKKNTDSGLSMTFFGNLRVLAGSTPGCSRWWFELNGLECGNPAKIDGAIYEVDDNNHIPSVVSGICYGIPAGNVNIVFRVGKCNNGLALGNGYTGWSSASRIIIEEI